MKKIILTLILLSSFFLSAQNCEIKKDEYGLLNVITKDVKCLAKSYEG